MTNALKTLAVGLALGAAALTGCEKSTNDKAKDLGRDAKDLGKDIARDANTAAKDVARDANDAAKDAATKESRDAVKEKVKEAGAAVKDAGAAAGDKIKEAGTAIADKAKEAVDAARKAFRGPVDTSLDKADKEITRLEVEQKKASGDAKKALDEKVEKAKDLRTKLRAKLKDLGDASADKWETMKSDVEQLTKDLNKTLGF